MTDDTLRAALADLAARVDTYLDNTRSPDQWATDRSALYIAAREAAALAASAPDEPIHECAYPYCNHGYPGLCDNPEPHGPHQRSEVEACPGVREPRLVELPPVDDDNHCTGCAALVKRDGSCKCRVTS